MTTKSIIRRLALVILCCCLPAQAEVPKDAVWIDVRTPAEHASSHLQQAILIPFDGIEVGVAQLQLSKDTPIYLYCAAGGRSETAKKRLEAEGYTNVTNAGGLEEARILAASSKE